jgi:hypothetical protein
MCRQELAQLLMKFAKHLFQQRYIFHVDVSIEWVDPSINDYQSGIVTIHLTTPSGVAVLD